MLKRMMDIVLALLGIFLALPFFPLIAIGIKLDSHGPVFYRCDRVGKDMKLFKMYKFRTMLKTSVKAGGSISPRLDPRVTRFGRFLRRTKINEVPQFLNILKNDMSFVGPRPEAPDLAQLYPEDAKRIFSVKPGLVGPNQVTPRGRNEEELYPAGVDAARFYIEEILPEKVKIDLEYIDNPRLLKDIKYIFLGVKETLSGALSRERIRKTIPQILLFLADNIISIMSYLLADAICAGNVLKGIRSGIPPTFILGLIVIRGGIFYWVGMYDSLIPFIDYQEIFRVIKGVTVGSVLFAFLNVMCKIPIYGGLAAVIDWCFLVQLLSYMRFGLKLAADRSSSKVKMQGGNRVLIFGADRMGELAYRSLLTDKNRPVEFIGFIDDDPQKHGKRLNGVRVMGNRHDLEALARIHNVSEIIIALSDGMPCQVSEILNICRKAGLRGQIFPLMRKCDEIFPPCPSLRSVEIPELVQVRKIQKNR